METVLIIAIVCFTLYRVHENIVVLKIYRERSNRNGRSKQNTSVRVSDK